MYNIEIEKDNENICAAMKWTQLSDKASSIKENQGVYFIRSSITGAAETLIWLIYNSIREIESSFRCLKTDLELRPVFHKSEEGCDAHLQLGLLAYWIVNTIRFQLKKADIHSDWREIVRIMNTQKCVTTTMQNNKGESLCIRRCSEPTEKVKRIYATLNMKEAPFVRKKSVVRKTGTIKNCKSDLQIDTG
jgi:transposase